MKTSIPLIITGLTACAAFWAMPEIAHAQIFAANYEDGTIAEYNLDGTLMNATLISGLDKPSGIVVSGGDLFVANSGSGTIGEYNLDGTPVETSLIQGLSSPTEIGVYGGDLYVVNSAIQTIGEYTTSGMAVNTALITKQGIGYGGNPLGFTLYGSDLFIENLYGDDLSLYNFNGTGTPTLVKMSLIPGYENPDYLAVSGGNLFIGNYDSIGEYNLDGTSISAPLLSGLSSQLGFAMYGGDIFVATYNGGISGGVIGEYATSGTVVNATLVSSGLDPTFTIAVVPEPTTLALAGFCGLSLLLFRHQRK